MSAIARIWIGDALDVLRYMPSGRVHCCVTSPPYWDQRDYGVEGQIGRGQSLEAYIASTVAVFREVRRVLRKDGTLWLNLGDGYASTAGGSMGDPLRQDGIFSRASDGSAKARQKMRPKPPAGLKPKDLIGIPWRVAFALQADGWYLRADNIWHKPNPMPESVTDRTTRAHEYMFMLSKSGSYYYDAEAIKEPSVYATDDRKARNDSRRNVEGVNAVQGKNERSGERRKAGFNERWNANDCKRTDPKIHARSALGIDERKNPNLYETRNKRSVWTIPPQPYADEHFAAFPEKLVEPCILAGCMGGGASCLILSRVPELRARSP